MNRNAVIEALERDREYTARNKTTAMDKLASRIGGRRRQKSQGQQMYG